MKHSLARRAVIICWSVGVLAAIVRLMLAPAVWEAIAVSAIICSYGAWQLNAFFEGRSMLSAFGREIPSAGGSDGTLERRAYASLWLAALGFGVFNLVFGFVLGA